MSSAGSPDYLVTTRYQVDDASSEAIKRIRGETIGMGNAVQKLQMGLGVLAGAYFAARGAAWSFFALKGKMVDYNEQLKATQIGLAAMLTTAAEFRGASTTLEKFNRSMVIAPQIVDDLRKTAAKGVGELQDYLGGFQILLTPMMQAGRSTKDITETVKLLVPLSKTLQYNMQFASMDIQQMLMGVSTTRDRLPKYLGLSTVAMNKLARSAGGAGKVLDVIMGKMRQWEPAAQKFGESFIAQTDTLKDQIRTMWGRSGEALTKELTKAVIKVVGTIDKNQKAIDKWIDGTGEKIASTFIKGFEIAYDITMKVVDNWDKLKVTAEAILEVWLAVKAAQLAMAAINVGTGAVGLARGLLGGGAAGGAGSAGAGLLMSTLRGPVAPMSPGMLALSAGLLNPAGADRLQQQQGASPVHAGMTRFGERLGYVSSAASKLSTAFLGLGATIASAAIGYHIGTWIDGMYDLSGKLADAFNWIINGEYRDKAADAEAREFRRRGVAQEAFVGYAQSVLPTGGLGKQYATPESTVQQMAIAHLTAGTLNTIATVGQKVDVSNVAQELVDAIMDNSIMWKAGQSDVMWARTYEAALAIALNKDWFGVVAEGFTEEIVRKMWGTSDPAASGKTKINQDFRGSKFEVKIDARDKDPDAIAFVFADMVNKQIEFQTRSAFSLAGAP